MDQNRPLAPLLVGRGTLINFRDILRALETIENARFVYTVDGDIVDEGEGSLVKLMADAESSTLFVNGCIFLNVGSFRYLDFGQDEDGQWIFTLHGDGSTVELTALPDSDEDSADRRQRLFAEEMAVDLNSLIASDDEEDED